MSWFIKSVGTPAAVKAAIQKDPSLSANLKAALSDMCDDPPYDRSGHDTISIEGSGHSGQGSYINSLRVERFTLAKEPAPAEPPAAAPASQ